MKEEKALRNLRLAIYTPIVFAVLFLGLDFLGRESETMLDFNRLFSVMTPLQMAGGILLFLGLNTLIYFGAYRKTLRSKE